MNPKTLIMAGLTLVPAAATPNVAAEVSKQVLPNGMVVLVKEVHSAPVVAVNAWVKAGSVNENEKERGITHFIEHMLFKGTEKVKVGELDKMIKAAGGYNNAHTRYESTDFIDVLPSDKFEVAVSSMADAMMNSTFDAEELERERLVVLHELSRAQDNPSFEAWNKLTNLVFEKHPYRFPIIGYKPLLQEMKRADLVGYWKNYYRPQNIVFVVVGDVKAAEVQARVAKAFAGWKEQAQKPKPFPSEPPQKSLRLEEFSGDIKTTISVLGVPGPSELDDDAAPVDVALAILGQGLSSRLNQQVREKKKLVQSVQAGQFNGASPGLIYLWAELETGQVKDAAKAVWEEVERMKKEPVSKDELARQMVRLEHEEAQERMSMEGMAGKLGYYECLGDYQLADKLTSRLRAVKAADIQRVMSKYFRPERATLVISRPKNSKALGLTAAQWEKELSGAVAGEAALPKAGKASGGLHRFEFANGLKLIVKPIRHTPLVAMQALVPGGTRFESPAKAGAFNLLARTLFKGAPGLNAEELANRIDDLGASLGPYSDSDRFALAGQMLSSKFEETLELAGVILRHATLPEEEIKKERDRVLKDIKDKTDQPDDYVSDIFAEAFYKGQPYALPGEGTRKSVSGLKRDDLLDLQKRFINPGQMLLVLTGDLDPAQAAKVVDKVFGPARWEAGTPVKARESAPLRARAAKAREKIPKKQAHIILGWPGPNPTSSDYYAARLLNSVMGEGMDSRLFREVREKRALCYSVSSSMDRRIEPGAWRIYVGTDPEKEKEATETCLRVARELAGDGITAEELKAAKAYAKGIFKVARQDFSTEARILANYEYWGLGAEIVDGLDKAVDAVTLEDVKRVAKKYLQTDKTVIAVVRP